MKSLTRFALLSASACLFALPVPSFAQAKVRIAIWDFDNNAANQGWSFYNQLGPAARNQIDAAIGEDPKLSAVFSVIERDKLGLVLKEQGLAMGGALDPQTAAKVGKILGIRYILTGGIDKFSISTTKGGIGIIGGSKTTAAVSISIRFVDTTTAAREAALSADGTVSKGGGNVGSANLSSSEQFGIASDAIQKAAKAVVAKLSAGDVVTKIASANGPTGGVDARVIKVDGDQCYINVGSSSGIKVGDKFRIFEAGEELIDPVTGAKLGSTEKQTGTGVVTEVQEKFAIMTVTGKASAKAILKK